MVIFNYQLEKLVAKTLTTVASIDNPAIQLFITCSFLFSLSFSSLSSETKHTLDAPTIIAKIPKTICNSSDDISRLMVKYV